MSCYLCGRNSAPVRVERQGQPDEVYQVCGVCDERGVYCFTCDVPLGDRDEKYELDGGWGVPSGDFECERCAETRFEFYAESMVM
jgi:hypothetical protein